MVARRRLDDGQAGDRPEQGPTGGSCTASTRATCILSWGRHARGSVRFRVTLDGRPPGAAHGLDVDEGGNGTVSEPRLYQLVRQPKPIVDRSSRSSSSMPA